MDFMIYPIVGFGTDRFDMLNKEDALKLMEKALSFCYKNKKWLLIDTARVYPNSEEWVNEFVEKISKQEQKWLNYLLITVKIGISFSDGNICFEQNEDFLHLHIQDSLKKLKSINNLEYDYKPKLICILHRMELNKENANPLLSDIAWIKRFKVLAEYKNYFTSFGLSEISYRQLKQAMSCANEAGIKLDYVESAYSLFFRRLEKNGVYKFCQKNNITILSYTTLARGMISDKLYNHFKDLLFIKNPLEMQEKIFSLLNIKNSFYRQLDLFSESYIINNFQKIFSFYNLCDFWDRNPVHVAITYVIKKNIYPILFQLTDEHLETNLTCYKDYTLSSDEIMELDELFAEGCIKGDPNVTKVSDICEDSQLHDNIYDCEVLNPKIIPSKKTNNIVN